MKYLFLDNLRGFTNTIVPIKDVNFLVGENSTGKTTILNLFYLMNTSGFWSKPSFNDINIKFGPFNEIINVKSKNQTTFSIGLIEKSPFPKKTGFDFILLTFKQHNQSPYLSQLNCIIKDEEFGFSLPEPHEERENETAVKYFYKKIEKFVFSEEMITSKINDWKDIKQDAYKSLKVHYFGYLRELFFAIMEKETQRFRIPRFFGFFPYRTAFIAPIRSKPKRTYDEYKVDFSPEGEHTPYLLKNILSKDGNSKKYTELQNLLVAFGKNSGLFDNLKLKPYSNEIGSPFTINVNLNGKNFKIINTGYGVSQSLPIVVELLIRDPGTTFVIQQPEVHLHPRAQATFGELVYFLANNQKQKFLIETHSDFVIDRFRLNCKKNEAENIQAQVLFFEKSKKGNTVVPIPITSSGQYDENQPRGFRDFFIKEDLALLGI